MDGSFIDFNEVQFSKARTGISVISALDRSMLSNEEQSLKARLSIFFSPFPPSEKVMVFRLEAPQNAPFSIRSRLFESLIDVISLSLKKAFSQTPTTGIPSKSVIRASISVLFE